MSKKFSGVNAQKFMFWALNPKGGKLDQKQIESLIASKPPAVEGTRIQDRKKFLQYAVSGMRWQHREHVKKQTGRCQPNLVGGWIASIHQGFAQKLLRFAYNADDVEFADFKDPAFSEIGNGKGPWRSLQLIAVTTALLAFLDFSSRRYAWFSGPLRTMQFLAEASSGLKNVYFFSFYRAYDYLIATYLHRFTDLRVIAIFHEQLAGVYAPNFQIGCEVCVTADMQREEVVHMIEAGSFKASDVLLADFYEAFPEEVPDSAEVCFDLGFISSGEWARKYGTLRVPAEELLDLGVGVYSDNEFAKEADSILLSMVEYARENDLKLCIYPHPYERDLLTQGICPPWISYCDKKNVFYEESVSKDSHLQVCEAQVSVSLGSTLTYKRIDLGFQDSFNYAFFPDGSSRVNLGAMGKYQRNFFVDLNALRMELDSIFREQRSDH